MPDAFVNFDIAISPIWTGVHMFMQPVVFSVDQRYSIANLVAENQKLGDIVSFNGKQWSCLPMGAANLVLMSGARGLRWSKVDISSNIDGVLPINHGGTGRTEYSSDGILYVANNSLDTHTFPNEHSVLVYDGKLSWKPIAELSIPEPTILSVDSLANLDCIGNQVVFTQPSPILRLQDDVSGGFSVKDHELVLGVNIKELGTLEASLPGAAVRLSLAAAADQPFWSIERRQGDQTTTLWSVDNTGKLLSGEIPCKFISGVLAPLNGGTGLTRFNRGDILYSSDGISLAKLSSAGANGYYLKVVDGLPVYAPLDSVGFDGKFTLSVTLMPGDAQQVPLCFAAGYLSAVPVSGAVEFDGKKLYFTDNVNKRHEFSFVDGNISGTASNITSILDLRHGGTGTDLSIGNKGQLLIRYSDTATSWLDIGAEGCFLTSQGAGKLPAWSTVVTKVLSSLDSGIVVFGKQQEPHVKIDQSSNFNPTWKGLHVFDNNVVLGEKASLRIGSVLNLDVVSSPSDVTNGSMWYDGYDLRFIAGDRNVNLTQSRVQYRPNHHLAVCAGAIVKDGSRIKMRVPVPNLAHEGCVQAASWRVKHVSFYAEDAPSTEAVLQLWVNDRKMLEPALSIASGKSSITATDFIETIVYAGELIQAECIHSGDSNYWSVYLLIELI